MRIYVLEIYQKLKKKRFPHANPPHFALSRKGLILLFAGRLAQGQSSHPSLLNTRTKADIPTLSPQILLMSVSPTLVSL